MVLGKNKLHLKKADFSILENEPNSFFQNIKSAIK